MDPHTNAEVRRERPGRRLITTVRSPQGPQIKASRVTGQEERPLPSNRGAGYAQASAYDSAPSIRGSQSPLVRPSSKPSARKKAPAPSLSTMDKLYLIFLYFSKNTKLQPQMKLFSEIKEEDEMLTLQQYLQFCKQVIAKKLNISKQKYLEIFKRTAKKS